VGDMGFLVWCVMVIDDGCSVEKPSDPERKSQKKNVNAWDYIMYHDRAK
jgi:hypothetical protein